MPDATLKLAAPRQGGCGPQRRDPGGPARLPTDPAPGDWGVAGVAELPENAGGAGREGEPQVPQ
eukprot:5348168-Alexandrium_andersonii.AAC.1